MSLPEAQFHGLRDQQCLGGHPQVFGPPGQLLVEHPLVRRVLIDQDQTVLGLAYYIGGMQLLLDLPYLNLLDPKHDDFVNSPISALRFISRSPRRTKSTPRATRFARLGLYEVIDADDFLRVHQASEANKHGFMPLKVFILWDTLYSWSLKRQRSIGDGSILYPGIMRVNNHAQSFNKESVQIKDQDYSVRCRGAAAYTRRNGCLS